MIEPGFRKMTNEAYHAEEGLSKSGLVKLDQSPAHFMVPQPPPTEAMRFGTAFHAAILEPQVYKMVFVVAPDGMKFTTKEGKGWKEKQDKIILSANDGQIIEGMRQAIKENKTASTLLAQGIFELSAFAKDPEYGFMKKCRPDWITDGKVIVDLKSTADARPGAFGKQIANLKYHWQAAWYLDILTEITEIEHTDFWFIVVEKQPPFGIATYAADKTMLAQARDEIAPLKAMYAQCLKDNHWPCYDDIVNIIHLPKWAQKSFQG